MTQLEYAKKNIITPLIRRIAADEEVSPASLMQRIEQGRVVIPLNNTHRIKKPCGIGHGLRTKVNANIGTSTDRYRIGDELKKLAAAVKYGADAVMDLSVGRGIQDTRRQILAESCLPLGTVPIYEIAVNAQGAKGDFLKFTADDVIDVIESQSEQGVDFFTIHSGVTLQSLNVLKNNRRVLDIVSRGGAILSAWMVRHKKENPFYEYFDKITDVCRKYDVTISLGDGLRPGSILDGTDKAQLAELKILGRLTLRARSRNVQVMVEGPGHIPLDQIEKNIMLEKRICHGAPFYVLGPLVTDVACGYDHISSSIGGAIAASYGADFLCYVTPSEHLRHPSAEDVREGVVAARIAAHAADIAKGVRSAVEWDRRMSEARKRRDWKRQIKLSVDSDKAREYRLSSKPHKSGVCTMCGDYCSIKLIGDCLRA